MRTTSYYPAGRSMRRSLRIGIGALATILGMVSGPGALAGDKHPLSTQSGNAALLPSADATEARPFWRRNLFTRVVTDQKFLFTTWLPEEGPRPGFYLPFLATALVAAQPGDGSGLDLRLERSLELHGGSAQGLARFMTGLGNATSGAVLLGGGYLLSRWTGHVRMARATSLSAEALLDGAVWEFVLKRATRRTRPQAGGTGEFFVNDPEPGQSTHSFPSGHATGAFAIATVFAGEYADKRWAPWVAYGTAGLIGWSRVARGRHFPTDVVFGALLGHTLGNMVLARQRGRIEGGRFRWAPLVDPARESYGVEFTIPIGRSRRTSAESAGGP